MVRVTATHFPIAFPYSLIEADRAIARLRAVHVHLNAVAVRIDPAFDDQSIVVLGQKAVEVILAYAGETAGLELDPPIVAADTAKSGPVSDLNLVRRRSVIE